jgi:hypothetical protein
MIELNKKNSVLNLIVIYFVVILSYSILDLKEHPNLNLTLGSIRIPILMALYYITSYKKDKIYFSALFLFFVAYLLFLNPSKEHEIFASIVSLLFRILIFILVYRSIQNKNWFALTLASIPFLSIYLFFIFLINEDLDDSIYPWVINGVLTSIIGGIAVYNYIFDYKKKNFWLLISAVLFVLQIGVFFINKYYLPHDIMRKITIILFGASHFTFYKFMILNEGRKRKP